MNTNQFDDLDQHPVVCGTVHEFEEGRCQGEVVLWVLLGQLADHTDSCTLHSRVRVLQTLLETRKCRAKGIRKLQERERERESHDKHVLTNG